jgi:phage shock protein C
VKRLYKSRKDKVFDGVCGGIAEYFNVDPVLVRIVFVLFFFIGGSALIAYIIGMIIMPRAPLEPEQEKEKEKEPTGTPGKAIEEPARKETRPAPASATVGVLIIGILLIVLGGFFIMRNFYFFDGFYWWFKRHFWDYLIPGVIIITGIALILKGTEK